MPGAIQQLGIQLGGKKKNQAWLPLPVVVIFLQRPQMDAVAIRNVSGTVGGQGATFL